MLFPLLRLFERSENAGSRRTAPVAGRAIRRSAGILGGVATLTLCACGSGPAGSSITQTESANIPGEAQPVTIYDDGALAKPWSDISWTTHTLDSSAVLENGQPTLSVTFAAWTALCFDNNQGIAPGTYDTLSFDVYGGANSAPVLSGALYLNDKVWGTSVPIAQYCDGGAIATNGWTHCGVPLAAMGSTGQTITEVAIEETAGVSLSPMAVSNLQLAVGGVVQSGGSAAAADAGGASGDDAGAVDAGASPASL